MTRDFRPSRDDAGNLLSLENVQASHSVRAQGSRTRLERSAQNKWTFMSCAASMENQCASTCPQRPVKIPSARGLGRLVGR